MRAWFISSLIAVAGIAFGPIPVRGQRLEIPQSPVTEPESVEIDGNVTAVRKYSFDVQTAAGPRSIRLQRKTEFELILNQPWFDIEAAYGYGGPLANTDAADFLGEAQRAFDQWCADQGVVAEFLRLHPLLENQRWLSPKVELVYDRETVAMGLAGTDGTEANPLPANAAARNMLQRARKLGVRVTEYSARQVFERFARLYLTTMDRLNADEFYYFDDDYFSRLRKLVEESGFLLVAEQDDEWLAAAVFLQGSTWLHYHLSAADYTKRVPGAVNLLLFTAAQIGSQQGLKGLHLGGGTTRSPEDSLLRFKGSMADRRHSFYIGKRVHNPEAYNWLRTTWGQQYPTLKSKYRDRLLVYRYQQ